MKCVAEGDSTSWELKSVYYTYVLMCADDKLYIGYTVDFKKRIKRHQNGEVFATKERLSVELIFYEAFAHQQDAKRRERYFKTNSGKRALKLMLSVIFRQEDWSLKGNSRGFYSIVLFDVAQGKSLRVG